MSGGPALMQTAEGVRAVAARMARHLGVPALDRAALEQMPAETILAGQEAVTAAGPGARTGRQDVEALTALLSSGVTLPWAPWADGEIVIDEPMQAAASPRHREVALLAGATAHEFNMAWIPADWITADMAAEGLAKAGVPAPLAAVYLDRAGPRPGGAVGQAVTDRTFRVPAQHLATAKAEAGGPAYTYDFRWAPRTGPLAGLAFHCLDVPFFFDALGGPGVAEAAGPAPPGALAADMHGALARFVTDGAPGWEPYGAGRRPVMVFAEPSGVQEDPLEMERTAWT
jgi:para-nitrobenzyl esterase